MNVLDPRRAGAHMEPGVTYARIDTTGTERFVTLRRVLDGLEAKDSGRFLSYEGAELPW